MHFNLYKTLLRRFFMKCCVIALIPITSIQAQQTTFEQQLSTADNYGKKIDIYVEAGRKTGEMDFENVIDLSNEGLALAKTKNDKANIGILQRHIGNSYYFQGKYDKAASAFYKSLESLEQIKISNELAETYNSTAKLFRKTKDLEKSAQFYEKALGIYRALKDSAGLATIYNEYGVVYEYKDEMKTAEKYYTQSLNINKALKNSEGICYALNNLSGLFTIQKDFGKAQDYLGQTLMLRKLLNDSLALAMTYADFGNTFLVAQNFKEAKFYFDSSIYIAKKLNYPELLATSLKGRAEAYEGVGSWQAAVENYKAQKNISDSIYNIESAAKVEEINTKYETGKKQNKILEQQIQIKQRNMYLFGLVSLLLFLSILAQKKYRDYKQKKDKELAEQLVLAQAEKAEAILAAEDRERFRIASDLHDGVGQMMSSVKMNASAFEANTKEFSIKNKEQLHNVIELIDLACIEVRNVSHQMMPLQSFDNRLDRALKTMIGRINADLMTINLYTEGFTDNEASPAKNMLYRILQELINNAVKHSKASTLDINVVNDVDGYTATVEDNGVGFDSSSAEFKSGVGIKNIQSRLDFLNGTIEINSQPGKGACIVIYLKPSVTTDTINQLRTLPSM